MEPQIGDLLNQSIELELNVAKIYRLFAEKFVEDNSFWWKLFMEEENHASLLRSGKDYFLTQGLFPDDLVCKEARIRSDE